MVLRFRTSVELFLLHCHMKIPYFIPYRNVLLTGSTAVRIERSATDCCRMGPRITCRLMVTAVPSSTKRQDT